MSKGHCIFLTSCQNEDSMFLRSIGAYLCAHHLEQNGYDCDVIDFVDGLTAQELAKVIKTISRPDTLFIGVSTTFLDTGNTSIEAKTQYAEKQKSASKFVNQLPIKLCMALALSKRDNPKLKVVLGGAKASYLGNQLIDCAIISWGEDLILEYADWLRGANPFLKYSMSPLFPHMMVVREANVRKFNIQTSNFKFQKKHCILPNEALPIEIARGCIFACKFCSHPGVGKRKGETVRSAECVADEMLHNYENFGTTRYSFCDETFNDDTDKLRLLAEAVSKLPFRVEFTAYIRADLMRAHREQIDLLEQIGIKSAFFGIETFSKKAGSIVGKGLTGEPLKEFLIELKERWDPKGITFRNNLIIGLPQDTIEEQYASHQWHIDNKMASWNFMPLSVIAPQYANAKLWTSAFERDAEKYGYRFPSDDFTYWENDYTNYLEVSRLANTFRNELLPMCKPTDWGWLGLHNIGYVTDEEQSAFNRHDLMYSEHLLERKDQMIKAYLAAMLEYHKVLF